MFSSFSGDVICFQSLYVMLRSFVMINDFGFVFFSKFEFCSPICLNFVL